MLFQGWEITRPLTESSVAGVRAQVDGRLERFGVADRVDEEALEVLEYRAASYPQSADAQVDLGDAYRPRRRPGSWALPDRRSIGSSPAVPR